MIANTYLFYALGAAVLALLYGVFLIFKILKQPQGQGKMLEIAGAIQDGAKAYLSRQYKTVGIVAVVILILMWLAHFSGHTMDGFCFRRRAFRGSRFCGNECFCARQCAHGRSGQKRFGLGFVFGF